MEVAVVFSLVQPFLRRGRGLLLPKGRPPIVVRAGLGCGVHPGRDPRDGGFHVPHVQAEEAVRDPEPNGIRVYCWRSTLPLAASHRLVALKVT